LQIRLLRGTGSVDRVHDPEFIARWTSLWKVCPWATTFQSPGFVVLWYRIYHDLYELVLIEGTAETGTLVGLFPLAVPRGSRRLVGAGANQAEYQGWLAGVNDGDAFCSRSLDVLQREFPGYTLDMPYLPPGCPLAWRSEGSRWSACSEVRRDVRGLMVLGNGTSIDQSLRKKSNRSRLNRLERTGPIALEIITSAEALDAVLDEIAALYDLRQGAVNGITPFQSDRFKRPFHLALLAEAGLLHVSILKVGNAIASAHLNMRSRDEVLLGVIAHSPVFARHSPGKFHILLLGKQLASEGVRAFDLSPSGEYKDRFATTYEPVYALKVYLGPVPRALGWTRRTARRVVTALRLNPRPARDLAAAAVRLLSTRGVRRQVHRFARAVSRVGGTGALVPYRMERPPANVNVPEEVSCDRLTEVVRFLPYRPDASLTATEILGQVMNRLEEGDHVFTSVGEGGLRASGWLAKEGRPVRAEDEEVEFTAGDSSTILYDIIGVAGLKAADERSSVLRAMLATVHREAPAEPVIALVRRGDTVLAQLLQEFGFKPEPALAVGFRRPEHAAARQTAADPRPERLATVDPDNA